MRSVIGSTIICLKETDSTNNEALQLLRNNEAVNGMLIIAEKQTAGRGQRGNKWQSKAGENLTMSLILLPQNMPIQHQFYLNMGVALGIKKSILPILDERLKLKWANDIYYGEKKLGGILIENAVQRNLIAHSVIGIGLNVNQQIFDKNLPNPISLHQITNRFFEIEKIALDFCRGIEYYYQLLQNGKKQLIRNEYINSLLWKDEWRLFETEDYGFQELKVIDVAPNGLLITENKIGKVWQFAFGTLKAVF